MPPVQLSVGVNVESDPLGLSAVGAVNAATAPQTRTEIAAANNRLSVLVNDRVASEVLNIEMCNHVEGRTDANELACAQSPT